MKKKVVAIMLAGLLAISVTACSSSEENTSKNTTNSNNSKTSEEQNESKTVSVPESGDVDISFKNDTLTINDAIIQITGIEVAPPNETFGETSPTIIFTYDYTNTSDEPQQPGIVWIACFNATQETESTIENLDVAMAPQDEKYTEMNKMSFTDVKPGATVQSVISYNINDSSRPVMLTATQGVLGDKLGTKVVNLTTTEVATTPSPTAEPTPTTPPTAEPTPAVSSYGPGTLKAGTDIPAGEYIVLASSARGGYVSVNSDPNGNDIIFNENFDYNTIITVQDGEYVELSRSIAYPFEQWCSQNTLDSTRAGVTFKIGVNLPAGEYKLTATNDRGGYYCVYSDSRYQDIVSNDNFNGQSYVSVSDGQYLQLSRCVISQ